LLVDLLDDGYGVWVVLFGVMVDVILWGDVFVFDLYLWGWLGLLLLLMWGDLDVVELFGDLVVIEWLMVCVVVVM